MSKSSQNSFFFNNPSIHLHTELRAKEITYEQTNLMHPSNKLTQRKRLQKL